MARKSTRAKARPTAKSKGRPKLKAKPAAKRKPAVRAAKRPAAQRAQRPAQPKWLPTGSHSLTPYLTVSDAKAAIAFYAAAFGAKELMRLTSPDGARVVHAELQLGTSHLMLSDAFPEMGGAPAPTRETNSPVTVHHYVGDTDATVRRAAAAGATVTMPPTDMFWGDRFAKLRDPFGHSWSIATHQREVSAAEMAEAMQKMGP